MGLIHPDLSTGCLLYTGSSDDSLAQFSRTNVHKSDLTSSFLYPPFPPNAPLFLMEILVMFYIAL